MILLTLLVLLFSPDVLSQNTNSPLGDSLEENVFTTSSPRIQSWIERLKLSRNGSETNQGKIEEIFDEEPEEDLLEGGSDHVPVYFKGGPLGKEVQRSSAFDHLFRGPKIPTTIVSSLKTASGPHRLRRSPQTIKTTYVTKDIVLPSTLIPYIPPTSSPVYGSIFRSRHYNNLAHSDTILGTPLYETSPSPTDTLLLPSVSTPETIIRSLQEDDSQTVFASYDVLQQSLPSDIDADFWKNKDSYSQAPTSLSSSSTSFETSFSTTGVKTGYFPPKQRVMPRVSHMEAECSDDIMKLRVKFNATFEGLIYSAGYAYDSNCIYVNGTGDATYEFYIQLNRCGTLGGSDHKKKREIGFKNTEPTKNVMWNTVTIQYSPLIEEEWDEHFKVTCEYGYDFWKTVTFPFLDVEVNTADPVHFSLNPPECHMEIRQGYGTAGHRITGPVHVGDPLTLLINMRSEYDGFDILVNDCYAHNGANKKIQLIDHHGCPVDEKLISRFQGTWAMNDAMYETVLFAHMKTFRFTGTPALYIECDIRMCHGKCPTQSCNWRNLNANSRRRRSLEKEETIEEVEEALTVSGNSSSPNLSERFNLFQAIHVLQSREENERNESLSESSDTSRATKESQCVSSNFFTVAVGILTFLSVSFGLTVSVLYIRLKRSINLQDEHHPSSHHLQIPNSRLFDEISRISCKSEYVHSNQARIP